MLRSVGEAVLDFLVSGVMFCGRQAHALYETFLQHCTDDSMGFSLLAIANLKQLSRVLLSTKMSDAVKHAIVVFTAGGLPQEVRSVSLTCFALILILLVSNCLQFDWSASGGSHLCAYKPQKSWLADAYVLDTMLLMVMSTGKQWRTCG